MKTIPAFPMDRPAPRPDARPTRREPDVFSIAPALAADAPTRVSSTTPATVDDRRETSRSPVADSIDHGRPARDDASERTNTNREERLRRGDPEHAPRGAKTETTESGRTDPRERGPAARTERSTPAADPRETPTRPATTRDARETPVARDSRATSAVTPRSSTVEFRFSSDSFERSGNAAAQERAESAPARPTTIEPDGKARTVGTTPGAPAASSGTSRAPQANEPRGPVRIAASDGQDTILKTEAPTSRQVRPESPSPVPPTPPRPEVPSGTFGRRSTDSAGDPAKDPIARPVESNAGANSARAGDSTNATDSALHRATVATPPPAVPVVARPIESLTSGPGAEPSAHDSHGGEASDSATAESEQTDSLSAPTSRAPRATLSGAQSRAAETDDTSPAHSRAAGTAVASVGPETAKETAPTQPSAGPAGPSSTTPLVLRAVPGLEMQLAVRARELLTKGRTEIRIRLDPPELGRLRIQLQIEDHRAVARIVTSSPEAAALLARDREDLARAFQHHGFERVDVHIDADSENAAWDRNEGEGPHGRAPSEDAPASGTERSGAPRRAHSPSSSPSSRGVDLFV